MFPHGDPDLYALRLLETTQQEGAGGGLQGCPGHCGNFTRFHVQPSDGFGFTSHILCQLLQFVHFWEGQRNRALSTPHGACRREPRS